MKPALWPAVMIREATEADIPAILHFIRALAEYEKLAHLVVADEAALRQSLFGKHSKAFALNAEIEGRPVGFAVCFYNFSTFLGRPGIYIEDIFVDPDARGKGIGKTFFEYIAARAEAEGCQRVEWAVLDWNQPAIDFYKSLGAESLDEWVVNRLSGEVLSRLAGKKYAA